MRLLALQPWYFSLICTLSLEGNCHQPQKISDEMGAETVPTGSLPCGAYIREAIDS